MLWLDYGDISSTRMTYNNALMYCLFYEQDGKKGWRMPTRSEMMSKGQPVAWYVGRLGSESDIRMLYVVPVRDLNTS